MGRGPFLGPTVSILDLESVLKTCLLYFKFGWRTTATVES
jgi:hypothetical protein